MSIYALKICISTKTRSQFCLTHERHCGLHINVDALRAPDLGSCNVPSSVWLFSPPTLPQPQPSQQRSDDSSLLSLTSLLPLA